MGDFEALYINSPHIFSALTSVQTKFGTKKKIGSKRKKSCLRFLKKCKSLFRNSGDFGIKSYIFEFQPTASRKHIAACIFLSGKQENIHTFQIKKILGQSDFSSMRTSFGKKIALILKDSFNISVNISTGFDEKPR